MMLGNLENHRIILIAGLSSKLVSGTEAGVMVVPCSWHLPFEVISKRGSRNNFPDRMKFQLNNSHTSEVVPDMYKSFIYITMVSRCVECYEDATGDSR